MAGLSLPARLDAGRPFPLGASVDGDGVNFAAFSAHAHDIELCLFDDAGERELASWPLPQRTTDVWHGRLPGAGPGAVYALRAHGPWAPQQGHRFDAGKLLLDPYAREIVGRFDWSDPQRALKARVVGVEPFDWQGDRPPAVPLAQSVLYELHVRGFTMLHPDVPPAQRGTYAGLGSPAAIAHLKRLGVSAVNLLPVAQFIDEQRLVQRDLVNYWGYNPIGVFCPEPRYAAAGDARGTREEFKRMVRALHAADIEVILDVVFNHTAETDAEGPTIGWRGLDNASAYRRHGQGEYENFSGCGNTLNFEHPRIVQWTLDALRHWVREMHVDGFRFDLATTLGRGRDGFDTRHAFFTALAQDPLLAGVKLIAEPWDLGPGGYQLGHFPPRWLEWNDRFRDTMRSFWLGGNSTRGEFAQRLCASSDLFQREGRAPVASLNFVVSHDGFTLRDLLSYEQRRNEANGEDNRDGAATNHGWNCGVEGESDDPRVVGLRSRLQRALLATLLLAQGTPMLAAGDELGHSQGGNNNPYNQDNRTTWIDWERADAGLVDFCARALRLRTGRLPFGADWQAEDDGSGRGLCWQRTDGKPMEVADWQETQARAFGVRIGAMGSSAPLLLLINAGAQPEDFSLPQGRWTLRLGSDEEGEPTAAAHQGACRLPPRCLWLLSAGDG